ncbi:TVG0727696 [Thermoplasma volcanium GSS1]|uniref:TVG0727696 protein n=1 Tax=Thermoplasma volcanium (strain ATCC 51530 / DSM 4299 / JCM 9571 / NBRC 15438 / GSS1) TaxID=273116 RepID=Q97AT9_THEVO|nr:N-6 DNA methylase [Thermoplasma volcanium]BAB59862.1 TVG0727696 [Thermoplasma volcanium GSS1]
MHHTEKSILMKRRTLGEHLTSVNIFKEYILPKIKDKINCYTWVDLFAGEGNLILPILDLVPEEKRIEFFRDNIFLFDIQKEMVERAIKNAESYRIPRMIAEKNIQVKDTLKEYPLLNVKKPIYHITNPPYLYIGYIAKHKENFGQLDYFTASLKGLQDLYQIALMNDLQNEINQMVYIIPSNFLFGHSVSNLIRRKFLPWYKINDAIIFEKKIFENTGVNVAICFFERTTAKNSTIKFKATKINGEIKEREYILSHKNDYRAGTEFDDYIKSQEKNTLKISYYLTKKEIDNNPGNNKVLLLNSKEYKNGEYIKESFFVNDKLYEKIIRNPLFIRTVDTGNENGRAGLYYIKDVFGTDGIFVEGNTYRTNPIQVFIEPYLSLKQLKQLQLSFNQKLNELRAITDSEFMTTYKYSNNAKYTRKYLGLSQAKQLLEVIDIKN